MKKSSCEQNSGRIARTLLEQINALDDHLFLLRDALHNLHDDDARLKTLASELRLLVCLSSKTEGLLWRLADALNVDDMVLLQCVGQKIDTDDPLSAGLEFAQLSLCRPGNGPPFIPVTRLSLRTLIKTYSAFFVQGENLTHEKTISLVANQIGASHESERISSKLNYLRKILFNNKPSFFSALAFDGYLTLEIGERIIQEATEKLGFKRKNRVDYGEFSILLVAHLKKIPENTAHVASFEAVTLNLHLIITLQKNKLIYQFSRGSTQFPQIEAPVPPGWAPGSQGVFCLSYSSQHLRARTIVNGDYISEIDCPLGFLDAREISMTRQHDPDILAGFIMAHERFLRPDEIKRLANSRPPFYDGVFKSSDSPDPIFPR